MGNIIIVKQSMVCVVMLLVCLGVSLAETLSWDDGGADHLWSNSDNWSPNGTPGVGTTAKLDLGVCQISSGTMAICVDLNGPGWNSSCDLEITGGTLNISGNWEIIRNAGSIGHISMSDGIVAAPFFRAWHGDLVFDMTGGELNIAGTLEIPRSYTTTGTGVFNLHGGVVKAGSLSLSSSAVVSRMDITSGKLILNGNATSAISAYIADGRITAYGGRAEVIVDYGTTNPGKTTVKSADFDPDKAYDPIPSEGLKNVDADTILAWSAGDSAVSHDVYFGTDINAVANGQPGVYQGRQTLANHSFDPSHDGELEWNIPCYWRIDEVAADSSVTTGDVWSFTPGRRCPLQLSGDYTEDCYVNFEDFVCLAEKWLANDNIIDLDYDGTVTLDDFSTFCKNWHACNHPDIPSCTDHGVLWDMKTLSRTPNMYVSASDYGASATYPEIEWHAIFYDGQPWFDQPTRVFAYYALPAGASAQNKVPAIISVHGGGGTASAYEVRYWVQRGYACLAMDTDGTVPEGTYPNRTRHSWAGPPADRFGFNQGPWPDLRDHWNYHAVADIILANSLLRSMPEIDADNIGLKGVSWGGYKVSIASGIDDRIKFAMPLYGSGFWKDGWALTGSIYGYSEGADVWRAWWDAGVYLPNAKVPMLWAIGTNDIHFYPPSIFASSQAIQGAATVSLLFEQGHATAIDEPLAFANSIAKGGAALPTVLDDGRNGDNLWVTYSDSASAPVVAAELIYTTDTGTWPDRIWHVAAGSLDTQNKTVTGTLPAGTTVYYFNLVDNRDLRVSSTLTEIP